MSNKNCQTCLEIVASSFAYLYAEGEVLKIGFTLA